ncbi:MAG TPA: DNA double-strand break repair nuclease NurA [Anaerolineales bacterium]|nr:DNA double-strand break repair nuclease NurA [Anaerolineales bacterium]
MPINFQQTYSQIKTIGAKSEERRKKKEDARKQARNLFATYSAELDALRAKVESAKQIDSNIRCAVPLDENLASSYGIEDSVIQATLIAADGSQIIPNRHEALQYYAINVGAIAMQVGSGSTPEISTDTEIHMLDEFDDTYFSESQIALLRDVAERKKLLEIAEKYSGKKIAFTEGQLELWGSIDNENAKDFEKNLQDYLNVLRESEKKQVITAGYIDKPSANWVIKLLEIASTPQDELKNVRKNRPLAGATDLWLFEQILGENERSALFLLQSKSAEKYTGSIAIHFFYLNVGSKKKPKVARVDIPAWVANDKKILNDLHVSLIDQSKIMGNEPFPYLLHRAHEISVITHREKEEIDRMLSMQIQNNNGEIGRISGKQSAKSLQGRTKR